MFVGYFRFFWSWLWLFAATRAEGGGFAFPRVTATGRFT